MTRNRVRTRIAIGLTLSTLAVVATVGIVGSFLAVWRSDDPAVETRAGAARVTCSDSPRRRQDVTATGWWR